MKNFFSAFEPEGTKASQWRYCVMKKIALISASILALGAASIAAGADGLYTTEADAYAAAASATVAQASDVSTRGDRFVVQSIQRKVRLIASDIRPVDSCDQAYWPYIPATCLETTETAGL